MNAQEYIISSLQELHEANYPRSSRSLNIEEDIYTKMMSRKFRKLKLDSRADAIAKRAINLAVAEEKPITISFMFGGYKLWRFTEAPEIDWAELFSTLYYVNWAKSIGSVYKPGVVINYYSLDVCIERLNNIPAEETDTYSKSFIQMLGFLKPFLPSNVSVTYDRLLDQYSKIEDFYTEIDEARNSILTESEGMLPRISDFQKASIELNVKPSPGQKDDPHWLEKVELEHSALFRTKTLHRYINNPSIIPAFPNFAGGIVVGSTKRSYAKFWTAVGALLPKNGTFSQLVLTPTQLNNSKFSWEDVSIEDIHGKNFQKIRVLK